MPDDPNEDLLGYEFDTELGRVRVTHTSPYNAAYVVCELLERPHRPLERTARRAELVRAVKDGR